MVNTTWALLTPSSEGAIAIIQIQGDVDSAIESLTNITYWTLGEMRLVTIPDIDEVIAVKLGENVAQIMPHSGRQIIRSLAGRLDELGISRTEDFLYPEAEDAIEASMLKTLSQAPSPRAVDLLLKQPSKIRGATETETQRKRSGILDRLIYPPKIVMLGKPNTGKSTLMNALTAQQTSIVHNQAGVTRDAVGARIQCDGLVLDVFDLPGIHESEDSIEQDAILIAKELILQADLVLLIADDEQEFLETAHAPTLRIRTKADVHEKDDGDLAVSAHTGENISELSLLIREALVASELLESDEPWFFAGLETD